MVDACGVVGEHWVSGVTNPVTATCPALMVKCCDVAINITSDPTQGRRREAQAPGREGNLRVAPRGADPPKEEICCEGSSSLNDEH